MVQIKLFEVNYIDSPTLSPVAAGQIISTLESDVNDFLSTIPDPKRILSVVPLDSSSSKYGIRRNTIIMVVYTT